MLRRRVNDWLVRVNVGRLSRVDLALLSTIDGDADPRQRPTDALPPPRGPPQAALWPELVELSIRYHGSFAYLTGTTTDDESMPLCRLRYVGSHDAWGFAIYLASRDGYEESILPRGSFTGPPEDALDCACGLYLNDITAWTEARGPQHPDSPNHF